MKYDELVALMKDNGIVGAGGAGFPSYAKLNKDADTLVVNCAECEPLLRLHRQLMEKRVYEILTTIDTLIKTLKLKRAVIALKRAYVKAIDAINANIGGFKNIDVVPLKEVYPAGDEVVLIYEATGRLVAPGALPATVGVIVYNVETVYNIYRAMKGIPVVRKYVTVAGEVKTPQTYYVPVGTDFSELIKLSGGVTVQNPAYLVGGPMMGRLGKEHDTVTKTTNAIIVLPENHYVVMRKQTKPQIDLKRAMASCCQCHYCTDMCPRHLLGHPIDPAALMRVVSNHDTHNFGPYLNSVYCSGCGLCEMYSCGQGLSPRNLLATVKNEIKKSGIKLELPEAPVPVINRELRRVPVSRLRKRLDLEKYNSSAPMVHDEISPDVVRVALSQHIGAPAIPVVEKGMLIKEHTVIAKAAENKLSVNIHASITGRVTEVNERYIEIRKEALKEE